MPLNELCFSKPWQKVGGGMGQYPCYWNSLSYLCSLQCKTYLPGMSEALTPVSE